jgi:hypothetical protein
MTDCTCLAQDDPTLDHYVHCVAVTEYGATGVDSTLRCLAETAAAKDIDLALGCLRTLQAQLDAKKGRRP